MTSAECVCRGCMLSVAYPAYVARRRHVSDKSEQNAVMILSVA